MGTIRKKGLAVCMIALMAVLGMTVSAERQSETGNEENIETVSGGDVAGEQVAPDAPSDIVEEQVMPDAPGDIVEEQVMPYTVGDIASQVDGGITWTIDANGKLTVHGTGDLSGDHSNSNFAWRPYSSQITSAEIDVTGMTDASYLFAECRNMTSVTISGFSSGSVSNLIMALEKEP